jgi:hypothetical protein
MQQFNNPKGKQPTEEEKSKIWRIKHFWSRGKDPDEEEGKSN